MKLMSYIRAKHNLIFKLFIVVFCSFLFALMLPYKEIKGHRVDVFTAVWVYEDLIAEQDLLIQKSIDELKQERKQLQKESSLFFEINTTEKDQKLAAFELLKKSNLSQYQRLKSLIDSIYKRGVIESIDDSIFNKSIFINLSKYSEPANYNDFFTIKSAADFLNKNILSTNFNQDYLSFISITHYLNPRQGELYLKSKMEQVSIYKDVLKKGQVIVKKGDPLTNSKRFLINEYFSFVNQNNEVSIFKFIFKWSLTFIISLVLLFFLAFFRKSIFGQNKQVAFLYLLMLCSFFVTYIFNKYGLMIFAIPFALVPIIVRVFFDSRTALFTHLMVVLLCSFFVADKLEFFLLQLITGIGTLFSIADMRKRQQLLNGSALVFVFYVLIFVSYQLGFGTQQTVTKISSYVPFAISSMLVLMTYPIIYFTEKLFGFISDFKLLELCDLNQPLLRMLSKDVPGTFQHSLQVANLAEEAIYYIGGNSLLVRSGAMYHDIGKLQNPNFYSENQANGFSPHQEIDPLESAQIIINHVIFGIELAKKHHLPEQIIDFIRTHHGTTSVEYFLDISKKQGRDSTTELNKFKYPGPIPFSKETAVLMIADAVEAASRSLKSYDAKSISNLVDTIIEYKISKNQFINSDITFKDITTIKKIFKKRLMNIFHVRTEYPS